MKNSKRDDFSLKTRQRIMQKSGYHCSNPECRQLLIGPSKDFKEVIYLGVVAHICAAAPNGPRYDPSMTREERISEENGIFLCRNHATLIDIDVAAYPVELLHQWKRQAYLFAQVSLMPSADDEENQPYWNVVQEMVRICLCTYQTQGTVSKDARLRSYAGILYQLLFETLPQESDYDKQTELWISAINKICMDGLESVHCRVAHYDRSFPRRYRYLMEELGTYSFQPQDLKVRLLNLIECTIQELFQSEEVFGLNKNNAKEIF